MGVRGRRVQPTRPGLCVSGAAGLPAPVGDMRCVRMVAGVDFSGGEDAGRKIWVAWLHAAGGDRVLRGCRPAMELAGGGVAREAALGALRGWIAGLGEAVVGLDFPLGLPRCLVREAGWEDFLADFGARFPSAGALRAACRRAAGGRDLKRRTDLEARTPFSPYNLRLYRQTYYGIRDVLAPLVLSGRARAVPMQRPRRGVPLLLETCPASLLKARGLYRPYKGRGRQAARMREGILEAVAGAERLRVSGAQRRLLVTEPQGDALDSVLAALAAAGAVFCPERLRCEDQEDYALEGRVYW